MKRPSYPDPRRRAEAMNLLQVKNLHAEAVISGPHRLRTAGRRMLKES